MGGPKRQRQVTVVQGLGHAIECLGQLAQLVVPSDLDVIVVVAGPQLQYALVHGGHRSQQVLDHPATEVHGYGQPQHKHATEGNGQDPFEVRAVGEPRIHRVKRGTPQAVQQRTGGIAGRAEGRVVDKVVSVKCLHLVTPQAIGHQALLPRLMGLDDGGPHATAGREDGNGLVEQTGDLLLLLKERRPVDRIVAQQLVRGLLVVDEIGAQHRDSFGLEVELKRRPLHLVDDPPNTDDRCGCRGQQQQQHDGERSGPFTSQTPLAH